MARSIMFSRSIAKSPILGVAGEEETVEEFFNTVAAEPRWVEIDEQTATMVSEFVELTVVP